MSTYRLICNAKEILPAFSMIWILRPKVIIFLLLLTLLFLLLMIFLLLLLFLYCFTIIYCRFIVYLLLSLWLSLLLSLYFQLTVITNLSYCSRVFYDLALVFVVWLLFLLICNTPYGDFHVIENVSKIFNNVRIYWLLLIVNMAIEKDKTESLSRPYGTSVSSFRIQMFNGHLNLSFNMFLFV